MEGYWPIMFMLVVLKVPAIFMIYLLYWAAKTEPENGLLDEGEDDGGQRRPRPFFPRGPRRGPHGGRVLNPSGNRTRSQPRAGHRPSGGKVLRPEPARARERKPVRSR